MTASPLRGEIWFVELDDDPPGKGPRPVVIVSLDARNRHERADTVLAVPLTTSVRPAPTRTLLPAGESGLPADSMACAERVTVVRKSKLLRPRSALRRVSSARICDLARKVVIAMDCQPA